MVHAPPVEIGQRWTFEDGDQIWPAKDAAYASKQASDTAAKTLPQMQAQTAAQQEAAAATKKAADTSRDALVSVQRAFVTAQPILAIPVQDAAKRISDWQFYIPWENSGITPTRHAKTYSGYTFRLPDDSTFIKSTSAETTPLVLGPKAPLTSGQMQLPTSVIVEIRQETGLPQRPIRLFFWGWIRYNDTFKNTAPHITEVCRELTGINGDVSSATVAIPMIYTLCSMHNCADEECDDYAQMMEN